jgi:hypothetical protein
MHEEMVAMSQRLARLEAELAAPRP